jgi:phosphoribosylamine--glycine ligase
MSSLAKAFEPSISAAARALLEERTLGDAGARVVLERRLAGREVSLLALCDGARTVPLASAEDHKRILDGDRGPNTGGMGAYSPSPLVDARAADAIVDRALRPVVEALAGAGRPFRGCLFAGLMLTADGPMLLEFNCRMGDPETQAILVRGADDLFPWLDGAARGRLPEGAPRYETASAVCVVLAAPGYPGKVTTGAPIDGLDDAAALRDVVVFHAGTRRAEGRVVTAGGRVLGVTGLGPDLAAARTRAYEAVAKIRFEGQQYRRDIGARSVAPGGDAT